MLTCTHCSKSYIYRSHTNSKTQCGACRANRYRFKKKLKIVEYKGGKCSKCGYSKSIQALHFRHIDDTTKVFNISGNHCRSWEALTKELDKCVLLCANCHIEIHTKIPTI